MSNSKEINHSQLEFTTPSLKMRPFLLRDYLKIEANLHVSKSMKFANPLLLAESSEVYSQKLDSINEKIKNKRYFLFGVFSNSPQEELIGIIDLRVIFPPLRWTNIGYLILNQFQKFGFGKESINALILHAFTFMNVHRIEAVIEEDNIASLNTIKKTEMVYEGIRRNFFPGEEKNYLVYAINAKDFLKNN